MNIANEVIVDSRTGVIAVYLAPKVNCFDELIDSEKLLLWIERPRDESMNWVHRDSDEEVAEKFAKVYRELLSLRTGEGDEEVALIAERFQCGETEFHKIQAYKDLEGVAIARGQQLREAQAEVERLKGELAEVVGRLVWMHKTFSGTDEYRYLKEDGHREIGRIELAVKNQLEIVAASDGKSESEVGT